MKKQAMAFIAATLITLTVSAGLLIVGGAAYFNKNGTPVSTGPGVPASASPADATQAEQIAQLQGLVQQYQDREQQYQDREQKYQQQLASANQQLQADQEQFQQVNALLFELQQRGVIRIDDGRIFISH